MVKMAFILHDGKSVFEQSSKIVFLNILYSILYFREYKLKITITNAILVLFLNHN